MSLEKAEEMICVSCVVTSNYVDIELSHRDGHLRKLTKLMGLQAALQAPAPSSPWTAFAHDCCFERECPMLAFEPCDGYNKLQIAQRRHRPGGQQ
jgi:hypothetical protein